MSEKNYVKQEDHAAEECRINEKDHSPPIWIASVEAGPDPTAPSSINSDQNPSRGPGVKTE